MSASKFFYGLAAARQPLYERKQTVLDTQEKVDEANKHLRMIKVREGAWYRLGDVIYCDVPLPFTPQRIMRDTLLLDTVRA